MIALSVLATAQLIAHRANAQPIRVVRVTLSDTAGQAIPLAQVQVQDGPTLTASDSGRLTLRVRADQLVVLDARRVGFTPGRVVLPAGGDTTIRVTLLPAVTELARTVTTERGTGSGVAEFEEHFRDHEKGINSGYFVTMRDIEQRRPTRTSALFEGLPGIYVERIPGSFLFMIMGNGRTFTNTGGSGARCPLTVYVDGGRMSLPVDSRGQPAAGLAVDELALPSEIAGIEYYPSAVRAPDRFQALNGTCGVVLIWTKR
jgi:hypothetical protein